MFSGCTVPPDKLNLEVATKGFHLQSLKNAGVVLVSCSVCECVPTAISSAVNISEVQGCHL